MNFYLHECTVICVLYMHSHCQTTIFQSTTFGCCWDGFTPADGPAETGCPPEIPCEATLFGCCDDGNTMAQGWQGQGCDVHSRCLNSLLGCCSDGVTPVEGACMTWSSLFGSLTHTLAVKACWLTLFCFMLVQLPLKLCMCIVYVFFFLYNHGSLFIHVPV